MSTAPAEKKTFFVTHDLAFLHSIDTHLIRSGPEIKKNAIDCTEMLNDVYLIFKITQHELYQCITRNSCRRSF